MGFHGNFVQDLNTFVHHFKGAWTQNDCDVLWLVRSVGIIAN